MAVLGGIVFADDEVGTIGGEVVFMLAAEFIDFVANVCLFDVKVSWLAVKAAERRKLGWGRQVPLVPGRCWCNTRRCP